MTLPDESETPEREELPAWKSLDECLATCQEKGDNFYFDAFMFEAWIGAVITETVAQYAENKSGKRHLQSGVAWEAWQDTFGNAGVAEWRHLCTSLVRFSQYSGIQPKWRAGVFATIYTEDLSRQFAGHPDWKIVGKAQSKIVGKAQSLEKFGALRRPDVDELTIHWWPLLMRHGWTDRDLRCLLRSVVPLPDALREFGKNRSEDLPLRSCSNWGVNLIYVNSSAIRAIGYDGSTLTVIFHNSTRYDHLGVPEYVYVGLLNATSKGTYYNWHIRGRY